MNKSNLIKASQKTLNANNYKKVFAYICYALNVNINDKLVLLQLAEALVDDMLMISSCVNYVYSNVNYTNGLNEVYSDIVKNYK